MASAKQTLIVRPIFFGPISIALFVFCFAVALPLTTVPLPDHLNSSNSSSVGVLFVLGPALVSGLMVAYPTVTRLVDFCNSDFRLLPNPQEFFKQAFERRFLVGCSKKSNLGTTERFDFQIQTGKKFPTSARWTEVMTLRIYFRDLDIMKKQLLGISFDSTKSSCCDQEHQTSTGTLGRSFLFKVDFFLRIKGTHGIHDH